MAASPGVRSGAILRGKGTPFVRQFVHQFRGTNNPATHTEDWN
jgi:hypothetical protein